MAGKVWKTNLRKQNKINFFTMKEAVLIILDVGSSMYKLFQKSERSRLEFGIECITILLQQKIFFSATHEVGLMLYGADEAKSEGEDGNTLYVRDLDKTDFEFIRNVKALSNHDLPNTIGGDTFGALQKGVDILNSHVGNKKFIKRIFLITNGSGKSEFNNEDIADLASKISRSDTRINIIAVDFFKEYDMESKVKKEEDMEMDYDYEEKDLSQNQKMNKILLKLVAENCTMRIVSSNQAIEIYRQFRTKSIFPRCKLRTAIEITSELKIEAMVYSKTSEQKLPSLKKYSTALAFNKEEKSGEVAFERKHYIHDDPKLTDVDQEFKIKGYYYGKQLVPIAKVLEDSMKFKSSKCLKVLGFVDKQKLPRNFYIGPVDMIVPPEGNKKNEEAFFALLIALHELSKVAFVRYVTRENSAPKLAALLPYVGSEYKCFWIVGLPTVEDIRDFQFPSLKVSTAEQQRAAARLIEKLDLSKVKDADGEEYEILKPKSTINPINQRFYQCAIHRALDEDQSTFPPVDPVIDRHVHPEREIFKKYSKEFEDFKQHFTLKENPIKKAPTKLFWKELIQREMNKHDKNPNEEVRTSTAETSEHSFSLAAEDLNALAGKKFNFLDDDDQIRNISQLNPIDDFKKMITDKKTDLVDEAIKQMRDMIKKFVNDSLKGNFYDKAVECLKVLRKGCIDENEIEPFNEFLHDLRESFRTGKHRDFWEMVVKSAISLITNNENKHSPFSTNDAVKFLENLQKKSFDFDIEEVRDEFMMEEIE